MLGDISLTQWYANIAGDSLAAAFILVGISSWLLAGEVHRNKNFTSLVIFLFWLFFAGSVLTGTIIYSDGIVALVGAIGGLIGAIIGAYGSQGGGEEKKN